LKIPKVRAKKQSKLGGMNSSPEGGKNGQQKKTLATPGQFDQQT